MQEEEFEAMAWRFHRNREFHGCNQIATVVECRYGSFLQATTNIFATAKAGLGKCNHWSRDVDLATVEDE